MAYNKHKLVESAQKLLQLGKVAQAIVEFQVILKHEPRDQITLMTVGDLYVRQGETFQALEYFERLAQLFLADGFITKAIAIYKKIAKLAPEETRPVERLADLYVQQGVLSEARPIYLRLAELQQRAGRHPQAAALLRKLLDAEPDNVRVQTRLAELSLAMGQPAEACEAYRSAAEHLLRRGDHAEALKYVDQAIAADANDSASKVLKARVLVAADREADAVALLRSAPQLEIGGAAAELLLDLYLEKNEYGHATELAEKIYAHNTRHFAAAHRVAAALLEAGNAECALPLLNLVRETMTDAGEHEALSQSLFAAADQLPARIEPREWLVALYERASDSFRLPDALAKLAAAYQNSGQRARARKVYEQLLDRDPENEEVRRKYENVKAQLASSGDAPDVEPEAPAEAPVEQAPQVAAAASEPVADEETQQFVTQSLTDVDLFSSYGLTQKAIDLLEVVLQRAPRHVGATERLLDLYLGAGNERRTAELALELQQIHTEMGNSAAAERFAELHQRFERASGLSAAEAAKTVQSARQPIAAAPEERELTSEDDPVSVGAVPEDGGDSVVHEVDLSEEWAALTADLNDASSQILAEAVGEPTEAPKAAELAEELVNMSLSSSSEPEAMPAPPAETRTDDAATEFDGEAERESVPNSPPPTGDAEPELAPSAGVLLNGNDFLRGLSSDLEASFPAHKVAEMAAAEARTGEAEPEERPASVTPASSAPAGSLSDVFDQFRAELEEISGDDEDPETHYNLGIAYREMGLIEESISEFQKVAKWNDQGNGFRYTMQCWTLLGLAFMEKGQPSIAAMWYERALGTPGLDQESILALRYDLGVAQEMAGETSAARKSFSQVYGMNIDYRDVAERLAALGKGS